MARIVKSSPERRQEFIQVARTLFYSKGYDNTSVSDIIQAVGVSKGAYYHHFDSKQALLQALVEQTMLEFEQVAAPLMSRNDLDAISRWQQLVQLSNQWKVARREDLLTMLAAVYREENLRLHEQMKQASRQLSARYFCQVIEQGNQEGVFDVAQPMATARLLMAAMQSLSDKIADALLKQSANGHEQVKELFDASQSMIERTLGAPKGSLPLIDETSLAAWFEPGETIAQE